MLQLLQLSFGMIALFVVGQLFGGEEALKRVPNLSRMLYIIGLALLGMLAFVRAIPIPGMAPLLAFALGVVIIAVGFVWHKLRYPMPSDCIQLALHRTECALSERGQSIPKDLKAQFAEYCVMDSPFCGAAGEGSEEVSCTAGPEHVYSFLVSGPAKLPPSEADRIVDTLRRKPRKHPAPTRAKVA